MLTITATVNFFRAIDLTSPTSSVSQMTMAHSFFINCLLFLLCNDVITLLLLVSGRNAKQMEEV